MSRVWEVEGEMNFRQTCGQIIRPLMTIAGIPLMGGIVFAQADWTRRLTAHVPSKRMYPAMAQVGSCTSASNCGALVVMFGGLNLGPTSPGGFLSFFEFNVLGDTWIWDGDDWAQATPSASPPARYAASMAYDPDTGSAVLFGG